MLPIIISENQGGFVPNKKIIDNVIIVQEVVHSIMLRQEKGLIIKLDMANAFDMVSYPSLMAILQKLGFSREIMEVIQACISTPWIAPLINGRPSNFFQSTRGLRKGCSLSPFLYIIMAETLSRALEKQRKERNITVIRIEKGVKIINHSLFSDDTLLQGGTSTIVARRFKKVLDYFLQVSGGLLNNTKCRIYGWNTPPRTMQRISQILYIHVQEKWTHLFYLGLPISKENMKVEI